MAASIRVANNNGVVVGLKQATNEIRQRVDIDVLLKEQPDTFNIFLLALIELKKDYAGKNGYNELAGIHGLPTKFWDDVKVSEWDRFGGYCAHGLMIFPTWHRPYLALVEQTIYLKMLDIAAGFNDPHKATYIKAIEKFRLPYWDYYRPRDKDAVFPGITLPGEKTQFDFDFRMPDIFNVENVMLRRSPDNKLVSVANPLYTFKWDDDHGIPKTQWDDPQLGLPESTFSRTQTVRWSPQQGATKHDVKRLNGVLNNRREGSAALMLRLMHDEPYALFDRVATDQINHTGDITEGASGSLEGSIHGNYHNWIGGSGHMSHPSVAAFDPVFWFHHCQIDRLFAVWQALHPKSWFPAPAAGETPESQHKLYPFRATKDASGDTFFTSDSSRKTDDFGYTYPDIDKVGNADAIWSRFQENYLWSIRTPKSRNFGQPPQRMAALILNSAQVMQFDKAEKVDADNKPVKATANGAENKKAQVPLQAAAPPSVSSRVATTSAVPELENNGQASTTTAASEHVSDSFDREWYIDFAVSRHAFDGPFTFYFFIGPKNSLTTDPHSYPTDPCLAGSSHIFVAPSSVCDNCGQQSAAGQLAADTVPITPLLLDYMGKNEILSPDETLQSLKPEHVNPFLEKYLKWRIVSSGEHKEDPRLLETFKLSVSARISHEGGPPTYEIYEDVIPHIIANAD